MSKLEYKSEILLADLLLQEKQRNLMLQKRYQKILRTLPKGKPYVRKVKSKKGNHLEYVYLSYKEPSAKYPESKYIGKLDSVSVEKLKKEIEDRDRIKNQVKALEVEKSMIQKALDEYKRLCK